MYRRLQSGQIGAYLGTWICTSGDASDLLDRKLHTPTPTAAGATPTGAATQPGARQADRGKPADNQPARARGPAQEGDGDDRRRPAFVPIYSRYEVYGVREELAWTPRRDGRVFAFEMSWR